VPGCSIHASRQAGVSRRRVLRAPLDCLFVCPRAARSMQSNCISLPGAHGVLAPPECYIHVRKCKSLATVICDEWEMLLGWGLVCMMRPGCLCCFVAVWRADVGRGWC
jgi:hypothetical protein